eukprot:TRINITY_DN84652_c0_g1_i1.p1 TRINITY_DN84652_c0_g1~~TRINITY_DN84652_c0_g1_i1.p1  ORF type:complete len:538 (-),score=59.69 TRINITY_DN84652_c0_g1_i1:243-1856(-)
MRFFTCLVLCTKATGIYMECRGTEHASVDLWQRVWHADVIARMSSLDGQLTGELSTAFFKLLEVNGLEAAIRDCALAVAALILFTLPHIERKLGPEGTRRYFLLHDELCRSYGMSRIRPKGGHLPTRWPDVTWEMTTQYSRSYATLLGLSSSDAADWCGDSGFDLKFFVYETSLSTRPIGCSQSMLASEVFVHNFLTNAKGCRTHDPELAHFFFVPAYSGCAYHQDGMRLRDLNSWYIDLVEQNLTKHIRNRGSDHIFLWSSEMYAFPSWPEYISKSVFLSVEAKPVTCRRFGFFFEGPDDDNDEFCEHCESCFSPLKDVLIPYFVSAWSINLLTNADREFHERSGLGCFYGQDSSQFPIYARGNATGRSRLQELAGIPGLGIGHPVPSLPDYYELIGRCVFCFVPKGLGYSSQRLYEVMFAGCVPVILSDGIGLPFADLLDWTTFSVKWPMDDLGLPLVEHLYDLWQKGTARALHAGVRANRCWFDYHNQQDGSCSPYAGVLDSLKRKHGRSYSETEQSWGRTAPGRFWNHAEANL